MNDYIPVSLFEVERRPSLEFEESLYRLAGIGD
jgi:hypothetical protein